MKIYTIALEESKTYGHGDFGRELVIAQLDAYHKKGHFPPFFTTREETRKYITTIEYNPGYIVVELELIGE